MKLNSVENILLLSKHAYDVVSVPPAFIAYQEFGGQRKTKIVAKSRRAVSSHPNQPGYANHHVTSLSFLHQNPEISGERAVMMDQGGQTKRKSLPH
jgi:hypothetical protein